MRSSKGLTPVVAIVLLFLITFSAAGAYFAVIQQSQNEAEGYTQSDFVNDVRDVKLENSWSRNSTTKAVIRNTAAGPSNITLRQGSDVLKTGILEGGESRTLDLGCVDTSPSIEVSTGGEEKTLPVIVESGYCIEIVDTEIDTGLTTQKTWEARAYRNTPEHPPYANKEVNISFDGETRVKTTDSEGRFSFEEEWDVPYIPPNGMWKREIVYSRDAKEANFHLGSGKFQPPNRLRLDFSDGVSKSYQTQEVFEGQSSDHIDLKYEVVPENVTDENIKLQVRLRIDAKQRLVDDWNNNPDAKLLYQIPVPEGSGWGGPYAQVNNLECGSSSDISCSTGKASLRLESPKDGRVFEQDNLPVNDNGKKYVPINHVVESDNHPYIGGINPAYRFHHGGNFHGKPDFDHKYYFMANRKRMIYVPENSQETFYDNHTIDWFEWKIKEGKFNDPSATINTTYRVKQELVPSALGWWNPPTEAAHFSTFSIENPVEFSGTESASENLKTVLYKWNDVQEKEYRLNYTVTLDRASNDRHFMLPVHQGTFGMFPQDGGEALNVGERYGVYTDGMLRYPPYGNTGRFSFRMKIPGTSTSTRAVTYKITEPLSGDAWRATTYVLNTGDERIDNIYLLNSQGEWHEFERPGNSNSDQTIEDGETIQDSFNFDSNGDKKVQINMQFQMHNGGINSASHDDWKADLLLDINGDNNYNYDLSDMVECDLYMCGMHKTGNAREAQRITNLNGQSAGKSIFEDKLDSLSFTLRNNESSPDIGDLTVDELGFWIWYMQPYTDNIQGALDRPDRLTIKTMENGEYSPGKLVREFS